MEFGINIGASIASWLSVLAAGGLVVLWRTQCRAAETKKLQQLHLRRVLPILKIEAYVSALASRLQQIRSKSLAKLNKSNARLLKKLETRRKVNITKEVPYMVSFEVVNLFDVLASLFKRQTLQKYSLPSRKWGKKWR